MIKVEKIKETTVNIALLLKQVSSISRYYEKIEKNMGFKFNIFSVTKIELKEVATHSAMLSELLNPNGSHGQGAIFLKSFIEIVCEKLNFTETDLNNAKVFKEKSYNNGKERIDIVIELKNRNIFIENKIDASDGDRQIQRYCELGKKLDKEVHVLYLTKHGSEAPDASHNGARYTPISYSHDISRWLEDCIKSVALIPVVREAIVQYLYLVKKITGLAMSDEFNKEIVELLLKDDNVKYAQQVANSIAYAKGEILFRFFNAISSALEKEKYPRVNISNKERIYDKIKCEKFFEIKRSAKYFGFFSDIGVADTLFHVQVADTWLHYGFVRITDENSVISLSKPTTDDCRCGFEKRDWQTIKWCSKSLFDVYSNCDNLLTLNKKENTDNFIKKCLEDIECMVKSNRLAPSEAGLQSNKDSDDSASNDIVDADT